MNYKKSDYGNNEQETNIEQETSTRRDLREHTASNIEGTTVGVRKLPFDLKKIILTYKSVNTPTLSALLYAIAGVFSLFIIFTMFFYVVVDLVDLPYLLTSGLGFLNNVSAHGFVFVLIFVTTLVVSFLLVKSTPDASSNYISRNKLAGLYRLGAYLCVLAFLILAASIYA